MLVHYLLQLGIVVREMILQWRWWWFSLFVGEDFEGVVGIKDGVVVEGFRA